MHRKFKNRTDFKTLEQVKSLSEYGAGILATDTILIAIDDKTQSDILFKIVKAMQLRCRVYKTTRGKYFLTSIILDLSQAQNFMLF